MGQHLLQHRTEAEISLSCLLYCKGHGWRLIDNKSIKSMSNFLTHAPRKLRKVFWRSITHHELSELFKTRHLVADTKR
jgi:hypothetical protein